MKLADVEHALEQVRSLQELCLIKQRFYGYSGKARVAGGFLSLVCALLIWQLAGDNPWRHLLGWGILLVGGLLVNYVALGIWFLNDPEVKRDPGRLKPAFEALPALAAGAVLTTAFVMHEQWQFLMPTWMLCYGLTNLASRHFLDRTMGWVGVFYLAAGALVLLWPGHQFIRPWPMGLVFFVGELAGGLLLWKGNERLRFADAASKKSDGLTP